jgi:hypothetical protein
MKIQLVCNVYYNMQPYNAHILLPIVNHNLSVSLFFNNYLLD